MRFRKLIYVCIHPSRYKYIYLVISSKIALKDWVKKTFELNGVIQTISTMNPCNALFNYAVHGIIGKESSKIF